MISRLLGWLRKRAQRKSRALSRLTVDDLSCDDLLRAVSRRFDSVILGTYGAPGEPDLLSILVRGKDIPQLMTISTELSVLMHKIYAGEMPHQ